ncbi:MAG: amidophosphoribosyltransferase [Dehalococcoidaceae bacterium]|nr:amidophosphoribosyltransferase [Dehalococcoidaceae bacterium]
MPNLREKCGVVGIFVPNEEVSRLTFFSLYALQHRGQECAGIASFSSDKIHVHADMGLVAQVFNEEIINSLKGNFAIGHTRYSTTGASSSINAQPLIVESDMGTIAVAHNGNIVNADTIRYELEKQDVSFKTSSDTEVLTQLIVNGTGNTWEEKIESMMRKVEGAYSLTILVKDAIYAVRDSHGIRPLSIGKLNDGWFIASETCALDHIGAEYIRDVNPGEIVRIDKSGLDSYQGIEPKENAFCLLEYIYFSRPDSMLNNQLVHPVRQMMGRLLAKEYPVNADLVIGVPDSAIAAAIGYSEESGIPYGEGLMKNRYVGRTFIQPEQSLRERNVQLKFNPMKAMIDGKKIVVVDDSIVRGTTTPRVINMLRNAGAKEVHMRITSPPIQHPCFYGVDMASKSELIANFKSVQEIENHIGADSLGYLSIENTIKATQQSQDSLCTACFTGCYPTSVPLQFNKMQMETQTTDRHGMKF